MLCMLSMAWNLFQLCNYSGLLLLPYVDQGNRVAVNHADTVGLVQKRAKSCETADL